MEVSGSFTLYGGFPSELTDILVAAVRSVPNEVFFQDGEPLNQEVVGVDEGIVAWLRENGHDPVPEHRPFEGIGARFAVDIYLPGKALLVEIEKGASPRVELDVLKMASACALDAEAYRFGALVVPSNYVELPLAGRSATAAYLRRLARMLDAPAASLACAGIGVIAYRDPRGDDD